jgi:lipoprotein-anchoring transpeptidase ErfK/SrfK
MRAVLRLLFVIVLVMASAGPASARRKKAAHTPAPAAHKRSDVEIEAATRLQVFLDRANFSPGKLDGQYGDFTLKALALYRQSRDESASPAPAKADTAPDLNGIDLASVGPTFIDYTVTEADLQNVGPLPNAIPEKTKLRALPYRDAGEAIAEKFHCDPKFLRELNTGKNSTLKPGDQVRVPNVEPFELTAVKDLKPGSEIAPEVANDIPDESGAEKPDPDSEPAAPVTSVKVDVTTSMLGVFEGDKIIAAYPMTVGSAQTATPIGEWKVRGVAKLPRFRYDKQMLRHGERSENFHMLPPGPNSPVGVVWIALNKRGIGIHGTDDPNTIGQAASHGCIRLANWDIVRLAGKVKAGVPVSVH